MFKNLIFMKSYKQKDLKKRLKYFRNEKSGRVLKSIAYNLLLPESLRCEANLLLSKLPRTSNLMRVRNRCILTGRSRFILGGFNLSRLMFRRCAARGEIPGLKKSSW